jgi:hypothetical protein
MQKFGEYKITIEIETGIIEGKFPRRALNSVLEWYLIYKDELLEDWNLAMSHDTLKKIPPLE